MVFSLLVLELSSKSAESIVASECYFLSGTQVVLRKRRSWRRCRKWRTQSPDLKKAFEKHRGETEGHVARLEKVFAAIDKKP
jgi:hypothetical protein